MFAKLSLILMLLILTNPLYANNQKEKTGEKITGKSIEQGDESKLFDENTTEKEKDSNKTRPQDMEIPFYLSALIFAITLIVLFNLIFSVIFLFQVLKQMEMLPAIKSKVSTAEETLKTIDTNTKGASINKRISPHNDSNDFNMKALLSEFSNISESIFKLHRYVEQKLEGFEKTEVLYVETPNKNNYKNNSELNIDFIEEKPQDLNRYLCKKYARPNTSIPGSFIMIESSDEPDSAAYFCFNVVSDSESHFQLTQNGIDDLVKGAKRYITKMNNYFEIEYAVDGTEPKNAVIKIEDGVATKESNQWKVKIKGKIRYV